MRVGFPRDCVGAGPLRRDSPGKTRDRKIETSPEKVYRTGLAQKARAKLLQYLVDPDQYAPEFMDGFPIVCRVNMILLKWRGIGDLARHRPYLHTYAKFRQRRHELLIKLRNTLRHQGYCDHAAFAGFDRDSVLNEIEPHFDSALLIGHRRRSHASCGDVERHVPPVVYERTQFQAHFPDDLRPHMQGSKGFLPGVERQRGQRLVISRRAANGFWRHGSSVLANQCTPGRNRSRIVLWLAGNERLRRRQPEMAAPLL